MCRREFLKADDRIVPMDAVSWIDCTELMQLRVIIHYGQEQAVATGTDAIEIILRCKPSAFEGKKLRWGRHQWVVHNLIGHPLMQLLAFFRLHGLAFRVHDATVPRPFSSAS